MTLAKKLITAMGAASLALFLSLPAGAVTVELAPTDDMYSDPNHGDPNVTGELWVANYSGAGHFERIMMKFDIESLGAGIEVQSAVLHLYRFFCCPEDPYTETWLFAGIQDWDENTWDCHVHLAHEADPRYSFTFGPNNTWHLVNITEMVQDWADGDLANCGLVIEGKVGEKWSKFYSKDHANPSVHPHLVVTYENAVGVGEGIETARWQAMNFPNPFNPKTTVRYRVPEAGPLSLSIYDSRGRCVHEADLGAQAAGWHEYVWTAEDVGAGVYTYRLGQGGEGRVGKMVLLK